MTDDKDSAVLEALEAMLEHYVRLAGCGDCGNWNPEDEPIVISTRKLLAQNHVAGDAFRASQAVRDYLKGNTMTEYGRKHTDGSRSGGQPVTNDKDSAVLLHCPNCEATKQELQDFRQKVSDAVANWKDMSDFSSFGTMLKLAEQDLFGFIISKPKPDPLVEIMEVLNGEWTPDEYANAIRAALEARGFEIRSKNDD